MASGTNQQQKSAGILQAGTQAPQFTLHSTPDQTLSLSELRGRPVVLAFYPADWSPVCGDEMALFNAVLPDLQELGAEMVGISVDGVWCHAAFARTRNLHFPLLADFEPKGAVSRQFGAYREGDGVSERALFVVDGNGDIAWSYLSPIGVNPGADGVLRALENLREKSGASTGPQADERRPASPRGGRGADTEARA
jgi:peroxiredoxin